MALLRRWHIAILAWFVKYFRTREIVRVFSVAHAQELKQIELQYWPAITRSHGTELAEVKARMRAELSATEYRQLQETAAIRAGKMDIVDRRSWAWPFLPASVNRLATPIMKATPYNLRRMSRTPVPRRAMNLIKGAIITQTWGVEPIDGVSLDDDDSDASQEERIKIAEKIFNHPNGTDSFQTFMEQGIEDYLVFGGFSSEMQLTLDIDRPIKMWIVNVESVRIFASWSESVKETMPHYAQMTGLKGERGAVIFYDDEMIYIKDNPSSDNPFGLGKMEVAFRSVNDFLGVQDMSGRAGADQVHKTWLWWEQPQSESAYQIVRRHIQNELEGQAKISIIGGMKKPDVVEVTPVTNDDLLLPWQEMLIRMIANAFELSAMALGIEHDVNRAVGEVLADKDFRSAVVPTAKRIEEAFTRKVLHEKLGWYDLRFRFLNLEDPDIETKTDICSRMYSMNAATPREIRKAMGWAERESPYDDLTQFEAMMLNVEAVARVQNLNQTDMMQKTQDMQQQQQDKQRLQQQQDQKKAAKVIGQYPPGQAPQHLLPPGQQQQQLPGGGGGQPGQQQPGGGGGGGAALSPQNLAKGGQPPAPKPLTLPKFKIAGTIYNAKEIAHMPFDKMVRFVTSSGISGRRLMRAMKSQEPGILEEMSDEVRSFLEQLEKAEEAMKQNKVPPQLLKQWMKEQAKRKNKDDARVQDFGTWLQRFGQFQGKPGGGSAKGGIVDKYQTTPAGTPGNINPVRRG